MPLVEKQSPADTPHRKIIARFGGLGTMASAVTEARPGEKPVTKSKVQGWWRSGRIPTWHHSAVLFAGKKLKPTIKYKDFFTPDTR